MTCDKCKHSKSDHRAHKCVGKVMTGAATYTSCTCTGFVVSEENRLLLDIEEHRQSKMRELPKGKLTFD